MKRIHKKIGDSDDDMDNLPLKYISSDHMKERSIKELRRFSVHACEFCERQFINRYDYLIHNAKHIIIPLIKTLPYHCAECCLYCISEEELNDHMSVKHKKLNNQEDLNNDEGKIEVSDRWNFTTENIHEEPNEDEKPLNSLIEKKKENNMVQNNITENMLQNFVMNCKVDVEKFLPSWLHQSDEIHYKSNNVTSTHESPYKNHGTEIELSMKPNNIIISDGVNFKTNIIESETSTEEKKIMKSNVHNFKNAAADSDSTLEFSDLNDDPIVILAPVKKENLREYSSKHDSIHFDYLMKPGIFFCKRCLKRFPNRYEVIVHESVHLDLSEVALERYKMKQKNHSTSTIPLASKTVSRHVITCDHCHEEISGKKIHAKTCFTLHCPACAKGFKNKTALMTHKDKCKGEAIVNMCDACLYLRKRPKHVKYYGIMRFSKLDEKRVCHWCGKLYENISLVTLISRERLVDRIRFEGESGEREVKVADLSAFRKVNKRVERRSTGISERGAGRGFKTLSNRERLKLIQNRLKMMKK